MIYRLFFLIIVSFFTVNAGFAQDLSELEKIEDPEAKVEWLIGESKKVIKTNPDSTRYYCRLAMRIVKENDVPNFEAQVLRSIAKSFYIQLEFDSCIKVSREAIKVCVKNEDYTGLKHSYYRIGTSEFRKNEFDKAIESYTKLLEYTEILHDTNMMCTGFLMIGACQYNKGMYPEALESYQSVLKLAEESNNLKYQARALNNFANIHSTLKNYPLALSYFQQAIDIKTKMGDEKGVVASRENMAIIHSKKGDYDRALEQYESVLKYKEDNQDEAGISVTLMNIGFTYEKLEKFNSALEYYTKSLILLYRLEDYRNIAVCLNNIGDIYYAQGKFDRAIDSSQKSLVIGEKLKSKTRIKSSAYSLTKSYVERDNYKEAYNYHVLYSEMKDSLFNEESAKVLQEMETKYQTEKKQQEIEKQNLTIDKQAAQSRSQRIMLMAMLGGLVLVLLIAIQVYRGLKQKKKANALLSSKNIEIEEKNAHLNDANIEISSKKAEIEEKNLNIMDSIRYAKRIQQTILPRDVFVEKHLPESFILYKPKDIVSGDFYWMEIMHNRVYISAVDCTGHGVPGAFVSIVGYNSLNRTLMEFKLEKPSDILTKLNDLVVDTFVRHSDSDVKDGMDMSLISVDMETKKIEFAGAQNPLYIVNNNGLEEIKGNKQPIGSSLEPKVFNNHEVAAKSGDMVYLFTDGYIDQFGGPKGKKFMRKRFKELLQSIHKMDVKTQKLHLDNTIMEWMKEEEQLDDILVIGIRV